MRGRIIIQSIEAFTKEELEAFHQFLISPFFNSGKHQSLLISLYSQLREAVTTGLISNLREQDLLNLLASSGHNISERVLNNRLTDLMNLVRKFLTWQEIDKEWGEPFEHLAISKFYKARDLWDYQDRALNKARRKATLDPKYQVEHQIILFWIELERFKMLSNLNERRGDLNLPNALEALSGFFANNFLNLGLALQQQSEATGEDLTDWTEALIRMRRFLDQSPISSSPTIKMTAKAFSLMENLEVRDPLVNLNEYLEQLNRLESQIELGLVKNLAAWARIYCTRLINKGVDSMREKRIALFKEHLEKGYMFENGKIMPTSFVNIINIGLWHKELTWVKQLLNSLSHRIAGNAATTLKLYGYGLFYLETNDLHNAGLAIQKLRHQTRLRDRSLARRIRILVLKYQYEELDETIDYQLHAFSNFLNNSKDHFQEFVLKKNRLFRQELRRLIQVKQGIRYKFKTSEQLISMLSHTKSILDSNPIAEKSWLRKKVLELEQLLDV